MIFVQPSYSTIDYAFIIRMCFSHDRYVPKQAVKITRVPQQRTSIGWFYNKLIKGRGLPWPHALLLVDERHKQWRWSREVSLYDGSVKGYPWKRLWTASRGGQVLNSNQRSVLGKDLSDSFWFGTICSVTMKMNLNHSWKITNINHLQRNLSLYIVCLLQKQKAHNNCI